MAGGRDQDSDSDCLDRQLSWLTKNRFRQEPSSHWPRPRPGCFIPIYSVVLVNIFPGWRGHGRLLWRQESTEGAATGLGSGWSLVSWGVRATPDPRLGHRSQPAWDMLSHPPSLLCENARVLVAFSGWSVGVQWAGRHTWNTNVKTFTFFPQCTN